MMKKVKLYPGERRVYALFARAGFGTDVPIDVMYLRARGIRSSKLTTRRKQMALGMTITRLNRKLEGVKIVPGRVKRTYCMLKV